tara:strand:+ start:124 stop:333 length:210 start_codon:yes stop_codon:yes gene_type:complete
MMNAQLISEIERFATESQVAPATVTSRAVGNSRLYRRLKDGKSCTLSVAERLRKYMADNSPSTSGKVAA